MEQSQDGKAAERVFAFNRSGMLGNAAIAGALALAGFWGAGGASGSRFVLAATSATFMLVLALVALWVAFIGSKGSRVVVSDAGVLDRTRPWAERSLAWSEIASVKVDAFPALGHVVSIHPTERGTKPIQISSRHVHSVPEGLLEAIRANPNFRGRIQ